jgi:hypothetical protein
MRDIPLTATPNQSLSVAINGNRWALTIKEARGCMVADVVLNDVVLLQGIRFAVGTPLIPYRHLQGSGNFLLLVDDEQLPDWRLFGSSQQLVYVAPGEVF